MRPKKKDSFPIISTRPKRHLGQNFLVDKNIIRKIIHSCELNPSDTVLEIGPGLGALTKEIAPRVKHVIAIEKDQQLVQKLKQEEHFTNVDFITADFLKFDIKTLPKNMKVIGNLPYYICSPIMAKVLEHKDFYSSFFCTVQLEFGQRMTAKTDTKDYSSLTIFVQYHTESRMLFKIKNTAFKPKPRVHSCFMRLDRRKKSIHPIVDEKYLWQVIRYAFAQRRKTIVNALSKLISKEKLLCILISVNIDPHARAENLSVYDFVKLTDAIHTKIK